MKGKGARDEVLDAQMAECRELLADVRGATGDLRAAIREAKAAYPELAEKMVEFHTERAIGKMTEMTAGAIKRAEAGIMSRFDRLTNLLMTGTVTGRAKPGEHDLEELVADTVARHGGPLIRAPRGQDT